MNQYCRKFDCPYWVKENIYNGDKEWIFCSKLNMYIYYQEFSLEHKELIDRFTECIHQKDFKTIMDLILL